MNDLSATIQRLQHPIDAQQAYCCMTAVAGPWPQALCLCRGWVERNLGRHVEGYHVRLANGEVIGHLYYAPSERALFSYDVEPGVVILYCEWIQPRYQRQGFGTRLFQTLVSDSRQAGVKGILVEATEFVAQMDYRIYLERGFEWVESGEPRRLLYLPLTQPGVRVQQLPLQIRPRRGAPVEILVIQGFPCPYDVSTLVILREVAQEFGNRVVVREVELSVETIKTYGAARGIFVNGKPKLAGAENEDAIRQAITEEL
jgi:GNAT superfamily N-acetyltransferase